jgi:hypothetical protein
MGCRWRGGPWCALCLGVGEEVELDGFSEMRDGVDVCNSSAAVAMGVVRLLRLSDVEDG